MTTEAAGTTPLRFVPITMEQRDRVEAIRAASGSTLYVYTFASLFVWQETADYSISLSEDAFVIRHGSRGSSAYLFPCGTEAGKRRLVDALLLSGSPAFSYVTDADRAFLERTYPGRFSFELRRDDFPYLYDREEQTALAGKEFKKLRHQINLGRAAADEWSSEEITEENVERALRINRMWAEARPDGGLADTAAAETALRSMRELRLWGRLFLADGEDAAYVLGSFVTPEIFDVCFSKVLDRNCDCYIKWALYRALPSGVKTVDSEEDMGLEGLRTHKLLRRPKELVRVWKGTAV